MSKILARELIEFLETIKGRKLTPDELMTELNGLGLCDLVEKFKAHNNPHKASKAG